MTTEAVAPARPAVRTARIESDLMKSRVAAAMWFLLPMLVALAVVAGWPLLRTIWFSFTDASLSNLYGGEFVGFKNYLSWTTLKSGRTVFSGLLVDPAWWNAVWNTVRFAVISVSLETVLGMIVALVLNAEFKGRGIVRAAILIPWAIPTIVSAKMWGWMLNDQFGIINDLFLMLGLIDRKIAWTATADTAMTAVLIVDIWKTTPFMALLDPRRPADDPQGHLRGGRDRRRASDQGVLPRHPAAGAAGADGGGDLPPARRAAHLRPDLRADAQQHGRPRPCR